MWKEVQWTRKKRSPVQSLCRVQSRPYLTTVRLEACSTVSVPSVIAEVFNNYFSNEASNVDRNIPHSNISQLNFLGASVENLFFSPPSDREEIVNIIHMQKNKPTDLINIPVFVYKILAPLISPAVSMLFNNSLLEGIFSECLKTAKIIKILKSGDSNSTVNNRQEQKQQ